MVICQRLAIIFSTYRHVFKTRPFAGLSFEGLLLIALLLPAISERFYVEYQFLGTRRIPVADILFFVVSGLFLIKCIKYDGIRYITERVRHIGYILLPLLLLIIFHLIFGSVSTSSAYRIFGLGMFMLFSYLILTKYSADKIVVFISRYIFIFVALFLLSYIATRVLHAYGLIERTPYLRFPFEGDQSALFGVLILMLGIGAALTIRKHYMLYLIVPIMVLAIAQTGSRANMWLITYAWIGFLILYFAQEKYILKKKPLQNLHLVLCTLFTITILFFNTNPAMNRSFSFLFESPVYLVSGAADIRSQVWNNVFKTNKILFIADKESSNLNKQKIQQSLYNDRGRYEVISTHNIYLDYLYYDGIPALMLFILFLFNLLIPVLSILWRNRAQENFAFYLSICLSFFVVIGNLYPNIFLVVRFIWIFFGLMMAMMYLNDRPQKNISIC